MKFAQLSQNNFRQGSCYICRFWRWVHSTVPSGCYITADHTLDISLPDHSSKICTKKKNWTHRLHVSCYFSTTFWAALKFQLSASGGIGRVALWNELTTIHCLLYSTMPGWRFKRPQKCQLLLSLYSDWDNLSSIDQCKNQRTVREANSTRTNVKRTWRLISLLQSEQNTSCFKANIHGTL